MPETLRKLIECFKSFPGIGEKSAQRMAFNMLNFDKDKLQLFSDAIIDVKNNITTCDICGGICENNTCSICNNENRDINVIFIVEKPKDIFLFEKLGIYNGSYHVLNGLISPIDGISPEDIRIEELINRVNTQDIKEIIIALKPSIEGETTTQYIKKILENYKIKVSKIATGIPIGTDIEYIDTMTLEMALEERKDIS